MTVTLRREDGRKQSFQIVGEDEADPSHGTVSYVSPLARAVLTHGAGDTVIIADSEAVLSGRTLSDAPPIQSAEPPDERPAAP